LLDALARWLKRRPAVRSVEVQGHTHGGWEGRVKAYLASRGMARAVARYLRGKGVSARRLFVLGYGHDHPRCRADTEACRRRNARVELRVVARLPAVTAPVLDRPRPSRRLTVPPQPRER
jgi:outer membrane protein OmpA-like peptidoglycan-associated protein